MPEAEAPAAEAGGWDVWSIGKNIAIFVGIQLAVKQFTGGGGQKAAPATPDTASPGGSEPAAWSHVPVNVSPLWPADQNVDVSLYVSESVVLPPLGAMPVGSLILEEKNFSFGGQDTREITTSISVPKVVQNNGTLWAHIFVGKTGAELDPASPSYDPSAAYRMLRPLTQYLAKKKVVKTRNLLESKDDAEAEEEEVETEASIASYYHSNFTLSFVGNAGPTNYAGLHPATRQFYTLEATGARDESGKNGWFYPVLYHNTFWQMKKDMVELNSTIPYETLDMNVRVSTLAHWQFSVMASMDEGMKETARKAARGESSPGGGDGSEMEMIKEVMLDSNIYLLGTTVVVSILHMIFELLAFKSDVGHWRKKKDNVGVSVRTILSNVFMQLVIFLYLLDNNENTSWMILFGQGMGIAVEAWKITKTANVRVREPATDSIFHGYLPYVVVLEDKHKLSETEEKTEEYDKIAFKYMGIVAVPLLLAYAAYSLMYETHKSWYSFIIATLVGSVYAYGFLMMIPSLYINYRLKSVAHMPGRAMAYKFLNTFIDDLFAFTIKMPVLHRLATLRDDVIFFVYIYQTWAYKVDKTRVNEFGQGGDDEPVEEKIAAQPLSAKPDAKVGEEEALKEAKKAEKMVDEVVGSSGSQKGSAKQRRRG